MKQILKTEKNAVEIILEKEYSKVWKHRKTFHMQKTLIDRFLISVESALAFLSIMTNPTNDLHQELKQRPKYSTFTSKLIFTLLTSSMLQVSVTQTSAMSFFMVRPLRP